MAQEPPRAPHVRAMPWYRNLTVLSVLGLVAGVMLGRLSDSVDIPGEVFFETVLAAVSRAWTNGLRLVVVPLVASQLFATIASGPIGRRQAGRLGLATPVTFAGLLVLVAAITVLVVGALLTLPVFTSIAPPTGSNSAPVTPAAAESGVAWVDEFLPANLFATAASSNLVGLLVITLVFASAARKLDEALRSSLATLASAVSGACFVVVDRILLVTPAAVFALTYQMSSDDNLAVGGMLLTYVGVELIALAVGLLVLYAIVSVAAGTPVTKFARAAWAAQLTAVSTRSSLATVPPLMRDAQSILGIPSVVTSYVLPLAGATLKVSRAVTSPAKLVFLAALVGLDLTWTQTATAVALLLLQSPTTTGIARVTSGARSLPIYMAVGIPGEYALLVGTATAVTDWLMTLVNTTSYLSATALVARIVTRGTEADDAASDGASAAPSQTLPLGAALPVAGPASLSAQGRESL